MEVSRDIIGEFEKLIIAESGICFQEIDHPQLEINLAERAKKLSYTSLEDYFNYLKFGTRRRSEIEVLLNIVTINHTYFFRNDSHFQALKHDVLPNIIIKRRAIAKSLLKSPSLKIWSAGCSTGEEAYSIAIVLKELISDIDKWDIDICSTDISRKVLEKAREGVYILSSLKMVKEGFLKKYFHIDASGKYEINGDVKKLVNFNYLNLIDDIYPVDFDLIFCRNVVIYFDFEKTFEVMSKLYDSLRQEAYIFIGYSESLSFMEDKFEMIEKRDGIFYRKRDLKGSAPSDCMDNPSEALLRISKKERSLEKHRIYQLAVEDIIVNIKEALTLKKYSRAEFYIKKLELLDVSSADIDYLFAEVYSSNGNNKLAKEYLHRSIKKNSMFAPAYYLLGSIYIHENNLEEALKALRRAIYIDSDFVLARVSLVQVYRLQNDIIKSVREYRNIIKVLSKRKYSEPIPYSHGFNVATIMGICRDGLEYLKYSEL